MFWRVEVKGKESVFDAVGEGIKHDILDLGILSSRGFPLSRSIPLREKLTEAQAKAICEQLLVDPITQEYVLGEAKDMDTAHTRVVEVAYNPGVMDPVEESALKGIKDIGIDGAKGVKTSKKYVIKGALTDVQYEVICEKLLYNKLIQHLVRRLNKPLSLLDRKGFGFLPKEGGTRRRRQGMRLS